MGPGKCKLLLHSPFFLYISDLCSSLAQLNQSQKEWGLFDEVHTGQYPRAQSKIDQPCLYDWPPTKTLDTKAWEASLCCDTLHVLLYILSGRSKCCLYTTGRRQLDTRAWNSLYLPFPIAGFDLCPFAVINSNHVCNSFAKFRVLQVNYWTWGWPWGSPQNCNPSF